MTHRKISVALLAGAAILSLSACGGSFDSAQCKDQSYYDANKEQCLAYARSLAPKDIAKEVQTPVEPTPAPAAFEGDAKSTATYPGGVSAKILYVQTLPAEQSIQQDKPGHNTVVLVTVQISAGPDGYALKSDPYGPGGPKGNLLYGANMELANPWVYDQPRPTRVTQSSPVKVTSKFSLPASGLKELVFTFTPDAPGVMPYTFKGLEKVATQ